MARDRVTSALLLVEHGADLDAVDHQGNTSLIHASWNDTPIVGLLIDNGADVNIRNDRGLTALQIATAQGNTVAIVMLVAAGARE